MIEDGAGQHIANGLRGYFITLTGPGENAHRRWVQGSQHRRARPRCGCHEHGQTPGEWNRSESSCWNRARTSLARSRTFIYAGAVETQKRGLLHRHVLVLTDGPLDFAEVQEAALRAGYGCLVDVQPLRDAAQAGRYVAKYVTKSTAERPNVPWSRVVLDDDTGELVEHPMAATFRLWSSAHAWGVTMKQVRAAAMAQARARAQYLREYADALAAEQADGALSLVPPAGVNSG